MAGRQSLIPQDAPDKVDAGDEQSQVCQPGGPHGIDLTAFGHVLRHHRDRVVHGQNRQEAEQEAGEKLLLGHENRKWTPEQNEEQATDGHREAIVIFSPHSMDGVHGRIQPHLMTLKAWAAECVEFTSGHGERDIDGLDSTGIVPQSVHFGNLLHQVLSSQYAIPGGLASTR